MCPGSRRGHPTPGSPTHQTLAHQEWLRNALDSFGFLPDSYGQRGQAHRSPAKLRDDDLQELTVLWFKPQLVNLKKLRSLNLSGSVVTGAALKNGLLHIELKRHVPEELKPRKIEIAAAPSKAAKQIETTTAN